jgi:cholesterol oxidase
MAMAFDYEYLIIGSGFCGSVSALRLAQKGWPEGAIERLVNIDCYCGVKLP